MKKIILGAAASLLAVNANAALINVYESSTSLGNIAQAEAVIAAANAPSGSGPTATAVSETVYFSDWPSHQSTFGAVSFPGGANTTFVMTATGKIDTSLYSKLRVGHDDGVDVNFDGGASYTFNGNTALRFGSELDLSSYTGDLAFDLLFWENGGAATILLQGYDETSGSWVAASTTEIPAPASLALFGLGLAGLGLARRNKA